MTNILGEMQFGAQLGFKGQYLNFIYGGVDGSAITDNIFVDYTGGFDLSDSFFVGINAAYSNSSDADAGYQGVALYLENSFSDTFALGLRPEFFQANGASDASVTAITLAANTTLTENLKLITEFRVDSSDDAAIEVFAGEKSVSALTIAAVYSF